MMRKAIVTGATGFIGKSVIRELISQGVEPIAIIRPNSQNRAELSDGIRVVECALSDISKLPEFISDRDVDAVFHIAWQGVSDEDARNSDIQLNNIRATIDLIEASHKMGVSTFVGCGSIHEAEGMVEMEEDKPISNLGFMYKSSKLAAHWMGKALAGSYGIRFFWPLINTYGEGEKSGRLINTMIRKILDGESPKLSAGTQIYDFVHIDDVAHALYLIAEKGKDGANYTIGSGEAKPLREFLEVVGRVANELSEGEDVPLGFGMKTSNVVSLPKEVFDVTNLTNDTGFAPTISFKEGVRRTALWIKETSGTSHKSMQ